MLKRINEMLVLGGDVRQIRVANNLEEKGFSVSVFGISKTEGLSPRIKSFSTLEEAVKNKDAIILPLPCTADGVHINKTEGDISFEYLSSLLPENCLVLGGKVNDGLKALGEKNSLEIIDYFEREELEILNAVPTAEGALQIAMEMTEKTISGSECLILGFGRIGKVLAKMLKGMNADLSVAVRKVKDMAWIKALGYESVNIYEPRSALEKADIIFNTVPSMILKKEELEAVKKDALVIDLASMPGGVDMSEAEWLGIKAVRALSLPGKVAPISAGNIIADTIFSILEERKEV